MGEMNVSQGFANKWQAAAIDGQVSASELRALHTAALQGSPGDIVKNVAALAAIEGALAADAKGGKMDAIVLKSEGIKCLPGSPISQKIDFSGAHFTATVTKTAGDPEMGNSIYIAECHSTAEDDMVPPPPEYRLPSTPGDDMVMF